MTGPWSLISRKPRVSRPPWRSTLLLATILNCNFEPTTNMLRNIRTSGTHAIVTSSAGAGVTGTALLRLTETGDHIFFRAIPIAEIAYYSQLHP